MQQFGLAFLLGSFTVATWSDLKRLCAQREFVEIWLLFALAMLGHDVWRAHGGGVSGLSAAERSRNKTMSSERQQPNRELACQVAQSGTWRGLLP
jgi:hypothetical protein